MEMVELVGSRDCGNSPKNKFVQEVAAAIESGQADPKDFSEDVTWENSLEGLIEGRTAVLAKVEEREVPLIIKVEHAISHGKVGAASGTTKLADGRERRFSHVFKFKTAKADCVLAIKSFC
jgi:hypothetical protein